MRKTITRLSISDALARTTPSNSRRVECDRSFDSYVSLLLQRLLLLRRECEEPLHARCGKESVCSGESAIDRQGLVVEYRNRRIVVGACVAAVQQNGTQISVIGFGIDLTRLGQARRFLRRYFGPLSRW